MFFSTEQTGYPVIPLWWYVTSLLILVFLIFLTEKYRENRWYGLFFKGLQLVQVLLMYAWYAHIGFPLHQSLPFYHCRMAILMVFVALPHSPIKRFFMLLGFAGAILATVSPDFDPYPLTHVINAQLYIGHYALLVNAMIYLRSQTYNGQSYLFQYIRYVVVLNLFLLLVNLLTGGNYGFLMKTPLIGLENPVINFVLVSFVLVLVVEVVNVIMEKLCLKSGKSSEMTSISV
ncbi:TMEM164-related integral membrane acyltransferase [Streptococcus cameli]